MVRTERGIELRRRNPLGVIVELGTTTLVVDFRTIEPNINTLLREEMAARKMTTRALAESLNVRFGVVSRWLVDDESKRVTPAPLMCVRIADVFDLDPIYVFRRAGYWPVDDLPRHPHQDEIDGLLRLLARIMHNVPDEEWGLACTVAQTHLDSLQIMLNRITEHF